ncbi:MAG: hypothetical protein IJT76_04620 [Clostridia bacterium]|nr:hypothetical protein [Clostridia bacterium]
MKAVDIYQQFFSARCEYNGVARRGVSVWLTAESDGGRIRYAAGVSFFPHRDGEDYAVSYDAVAQRVIYEAKGRRSKTRETAFLKTLRDHADALARELGGVIFWDDPLRAARLG